MVGRVTGASHERRRQSCQDSCRAESEGGVFFAVVADGAGSAPHGAQGAQIAVNAVYRQFQKDAGMTDIIKCVSDGAREARDKITGTARDKARPVAEYATTLLVVALGPSGGAALQIGDGLIAYRTADSGWAAFMPPQHGEYANTTRFLTDATSEIDAQEICPRNRIVSIAVMSDGLERLAMVTATEEIHAPFLDRLSSPLIAIPHVGRQTGLSKRLEAFLQSDRVRSRTDDDLSIVVATRA